MHPELPRFIAAGRDYPPTTASANDQGPSREPPVAFALHCYKKSIQIQVYDVPFHTAK